MKLEEFLQNKPLMKSATRRIMLIIAFAVIVTYVVFNLDQVRNFGGILIYLIGPFLTGLCIAYVLNVLLKFFEENLFDFLNKRLGKVWKKIRRPLCVLLSLLVVAAVVCGIIFFVIPELGRSLEVLAANAPTYINQSIDWVVQFLKRFNVDPAQLNELKIDWTSLLNKLTQYGSEVMGSLVNVTMSVATGVFSLVMGFIFAINMLFGKERWTFALKRMLYAFLPTRTAKKVVEVSVLSNRIFSSFVRGQLTESCILGVLCYLGMTILQLEYALLISSIVAVASLIPILGAYISMFTGAFILLLIEPWHAVYFVIFLLLLQQFEGNVIYPRVVGTSVGLPGIWVLFAIVVGSNLLGMAGILLGIPTCSVIYSLLRSNTSKILKKKGVTNEQVARNDPEYREPALEPPESQTE